MFGPMKDQFPFATNSNVKKNDIPNISNNNENGVDRRSVCNNYCDSEIDYAINHILCNNNDNYGSDRNDRSENRKTRKATAARTVTETEADKKTTRASAVTESNDHNNSDSNNKKSHNSDTTTPTTSIAGTVITAAAKVAMRRVATTLETTPCQREQ